MPSLKFTGHIYFENDYVSAIFPSFLGNHTNIMRRPWNRNTNSRWNPELQNMSRTGKTGGNWPGLCGEGNRERTPSQHPGSSHLCEGSTRPNLGLQQQNRWVSGCSRHFSAEKKLEAEALWREGEGRDLIFTAHVSVLRRHLVLALFCESLLLLLSPAPLTPYLSHISFLFLLFFSAASS